MGNMTAKVLLFFGVVGLIFFAGSATAKTAQINLSSGPEAEGLRLISEATADQMNATTDAEREAAVFKLEEAKRQAEDLREAKIARANAWQKTLLIAGSFFIFWVLIFSAINLMASWGIWNARVMITPIVKSSGTGTHLWIPFPQLPFFAIQTWDDAPTASAWITPGELPQITESSHVEMLALARMLRADEDSDQRAGNFNMVISKLALMLQGVPTRILDDPSDRRN